MTDMKYTDEQIVRALACCANNEKDNTCRYCSECPASNWELDDEECDCIHSMCTRSISIINRQKEEIERWQKFGYTVGELARDRKEEIGRLKKEKETARSEAIKEFAERLKAYQRYPNGTIYTEHIDNLVKEMVGDSNAEGT